MATLQNSVVCWPSDRPERMHNNIVTVMSAFEGNVKAQPFQQLGLAGPRPDLATYNFAFTALVCRHRAL